MPLGMAISVRSLGSRSLGVDAKDVECQRDGNAYANALMEDGDDFKAGKHLVR